MASTRVYLLMLVTACALIAVNGAYQDAQSKQYKQKYKKEFTERNAGSQYREDRRVSEDEDEIEDTWSGKIKHRRETAPKPSSSRNWQNEESEQHCEKREGPSVSQRGACGGESRNTRQQGASSSPTFDETMFEETDVVSEFPHCQRYANDAGKLAKCERKAREKTNVPISAYPLCQKYIKDPYKLSICEQKASEIAATSTDTGPQQTKTYLHCDSLSNDPYKFAKCQAEAKAMEQFMSNIPASSQPLISPQCQTYAYDPYKLAVCEEKLNEMSQQSQQQSANNSPVNEQKQGQATYPQCQRISDPYKLAKCEHEAQLLDDYNTNPPSVNEKRENQIYIHCQKYAYDPYKLAKCESKAKYWISVINQDTASHGPQSEEQPQYHPQCQQFAYDPYKLAKCEYKIRKYSSYFHI